MNKLEIFNDILQPLLLFIAVTFLLVEVIKQVFRALGRVLGKGAILVAVVLGVAEAYFWWLTVLPDPRMPGGEWFAVIIAGFLIAGGASGVFSWTGDWLKNNLPGYHEIDAKNQ